MKAIAQTSLYDEVVEACSDYLGPAGERYIRRQISMHLKITPEELTQEELYSLIDWVKLSFALLTKESQYVDSLARTLVSLSQTKKPKKARIVHEKT